MKVRHSGRWKDSDPYVRHNGIWKPSASSFKYDGKWREDDSTVIESLHVMIVGSSLGNIYGYDAYLSAGSFDPDTINRVDGKITGIHYTKHDGITWFYTNSKDLKKITVRCNAAEASGIVTNGISILSNSDVFNFENSINHALQTRLIAEI